MFNLLQFLIIFKVIRQENISFIIEVLTERARARITSGDGYITTIHENVH